MLLVPMDEDIPISEDIHSADTHTSDFLPPVDDYQNIPTACINQETAHISLNAMLGYSTLETLRVSGYIKHKELTILIDGDSTHNFI